MMDALRSNKRYSDVSETKSEGATYTPQALADFVANQIVSAADLPVGRPIRVMDPAIGHGELLLNLLPKLEGPIEVYGFETDPAAIEVAKKRLSAAFPKADLRLSLCSFLDHVLDNFEGGLFGAAEPYDLIIANPPYVRTQIIGAERAKTLASQFGLAGRVDLYHAFLLGMSRVLAPDGTAGFIVSNRFMTTKGGAATRSAMISDLRLAHIFDLGDTKLFEAAVLPAVIIAKGTNTKIEETSFTSIYESKVEPSFMAADPISALNHEGTVGLPDGRCFIVSHGLLDNGGNSSGVWRLASESVDDWLKTVSRNTWQTFGEIGKIRVGVKTCADKVFIPKKWEENLELLRPLTTHHGAKRFRADVSNRKILYPHETIDGKKRAIALDQYPRSLAYLEQHRSTLEARTYVMEAGRAWYEIWVPQNPADWEVPKLVFRDISEQPTFWMDLAGTVVNGDCYWLIGPEDLLWLALAVSNSTFIERFYDVRFNNKLYAGRRRFITQYVEQFPLPNPESISSRKIITLVKTLYEKLSDGSAPEIEAELNQMVWQAFGLSVEET